MLNVIGKQKTLLLSFILAASAAVLFAQSPLSLTAELERQQIWVGDTVQLTIYLQGSEKPIQPDLFIPGIVVEPLGGTVRSSTSITNINGKVTENRSKAYVYAFNLTAQAAGSYSIPPISLTIDGEELSTEQLQLIVSEPEESEDFHLIVQFEPDRLYVHQECRVTITLLYKASLRSLDIRIPELENLSYTVIEPSTSTERYDISVNGKSVVFVRDDQNYNQKEYAGVTAVLSIRPERSGSMAITQASAAFESVTGVQQVKDFFGRVQNQEVYGKTVIPGSDAFLTLLPYPESGKPADFFGLSGDVRVAVDAEPAEVHIGDPITLTIKLTGINDTGVRIPELSTLLGPGFDIPDTRSPDKNEGTNKTIIQTVRVTDRAVSAIPAIIFPYFDPISETYKQAESQAVPLQVLETQIVTSADLEGGTSETSGLQKTIPVKKQEGIYYNYVGPELLQSQQSIWKNIVPSFWLKLVIALPPLVFLVILIFTGLVPQIRLKAIARQDRKKGVKFLKKSVKKKSKTSPQQGIIDFNRQLQLFLKQYGTEHDKLHIQTEQERINASIYGNSLLSQDEAFGIIGKILEKLGQKEVPHV